MYELQKMIEEYWDYSLINKTYLFKFETFFYVFRKILEEKISLHGLLGLDDYMVYAEKYYDFNILKDFVYTSQHTNKVFDFEDIKRCILKPRYEHFRNTYINNGSYKKLYRLYMDLKNAPLKENFDNVILMERCISAEHNSGRIIGLNIEKIRSEYEEKIDKLLFDKTFGILTRNGLEEKVKRIVSPFDVVFIDFNNIHRLNKKLGYDGVNSKIRKTFKEFEFRKDDLVGRWFSGDEIVIITKNNNPDELVKRLMNHTHGVGLTFKFKIFRNVHSLNEILPSI